MRKNNIIQKHMEKIIIFSKLDQNLNIIKNIHEETIFISMTNDFQNRPSCTID